MRRLTLLSLGLIALTACYDFAGERGTLGFTTDAVVGGSSWTPDRALATGARPRLAVTEILATSKEPQSPTEFDASRHLSLAPEEGGVFVSGAGKGWLGASVDGWSDDVHLQWRPARTARFVDPRATLLGEAAIVTSIAVVSEGSTSVDFELVDRRERPLGYVPDQLEIDSEGVDVAIGERFELTPRQAGTVEFTWRGGPTATLWVDVVEAGDVDHLTVQEVRVGDECAVFARLWSDGVEVLGAEGFEWAHDSTTDAFAPCETTTTVSWRGMKTQID